MKWSDAKPLMILLISSVSVFCAVLAYQCGDSTHYAKPGSVRAGQSCRCCVHCNCPADGPCPKAEKIASR